MSVVLEAARRSGTVNRFVMASSSSVYGNNKAAPFSEEHDVNAPISPYAATKRACELVAHTHHHLTGMPTACLRFFTVYGPRQRPDLAISTFMRLIASGQEAPMFGDGSMSRDFTYVDDIVRGVLAAHDRIDAHGYRIWNLGSDRPVKLIDMIQAIARVVGCEARISQLPEQAGDVERTWADLERAKRELAYRAETAFEEGLARQWAWMQASGAAADAAAASAAIPPVTVRVRGAGARRATSAE
jgi:UDP-glucuronate 4-epimerase